MMTCGYVKTPSTFSSLIGVPEDQVVRNPCVPEEEDREREKKKKVYYTHVTRNLLSAPIRSNAGLSRSFPLFKLKHGVRLGRQRLISRDCVTEKRQAASGSTVTLSNKRQGMDPFARGPMPCRKTKGRLIVALFFLKVHLERLLFSKPEAW